MPKHLGLHCVLLLLPLMLRLFPPLLPLHYCGHQAFQLLLLLVVLVLLLFLIKFQSVNFL